MQSPHIFTVTSLNNEAKYLLEEAFHHVWVEGELSNFLQASSGHWYFSLKDDSAQIRVALFKGNQREVTFEPKNGLSVLLRGRVSLYTTRGDYQLIADFIEERGEGKLKRAFDLLKKKLTSEGLFDEHHKKPLPEFPACIGIITSPKGAAIRDILHVLKRRYPLSSVMIYPTLVQGELAADQICDAIKKANKRKECDCLILARGGGSLEDLWPFNEEKVARAIFKSDLPIISGVGHEVDFTIADFVADKRAPTPSAAAEITTPNQKDLLSLLDEREKYLLRKIQVNIKTHKERLHFITKHLMRLHPKQQLREKSQRLDHLEMRLIQLMQQRFMQLRHTLQTKSAALHALSPLATLKRGYAIVTHDKAPVKSVQAVRLGDKVNIKLIDGTFNCEVIK